MLLDGFNHVALLTGDTERFVRFYSDVFGAEVIGTQDAPIGRLTFVRIGPHTEFNLFEVDLTWAKLVRTVGSGDYGERVA